MLRHGCENLADRYHRAGDEPGPRAILRGADVSRVAVPWSCPRPRRRAPWGRPGDDPLARDGGDRPPDTEVPPFMTTEHVAAQINPWEVAQRQFDLAADRLNLDHGLRGVLREIGRASCRERV